MRLTALCLCCFLSAGCRSTTGPEPTPWASVVIQGNTPGQISAVTQDVFRENGYRVIQTVITRMVFEKKAGKWDNIIYGGWDSNSALWLRVKVSILPASEEAFRLEANADLVTDPGGTLEAKVKYSRPKRQPIQTLLDEVVRRLRPQPSTPGPR